MNNNFKKFQKKPLFLSLVFFISSCVVFFLLFREINRNNQQSEQAQITWQTENKKRTEIQSLDRLIKSVESQTALLDTHFVKSSDVVPFLNTLEKLAKDAGVAAEVLGVDLAKDGSSLSLRMNAEGSFGSVYKFLMLIENSPYELEFSSLEMQSSDGEKGAGPWSAVLTMKLLSFIK